MPGLCGGMLGRPLNRFLLRHRGCRAAEVRGLGVVGFPSERSHRGHELAGPKVDDDRESLLVAKVALDVELVAEKKELIALSCHLLGSRGRRSSGVPTQEGRLARVDVDSLATEVAFGVSSGVLELFPYLFESWVPKGDKVQLRASLRQLSIKRERKGGSARSNGSDSPRVRDMDESVLPFEGDIPRSQVVEDNLSNLVLHGLSLPSRIDQRRCAKRPLPWSYAVEHVQSLR
jgi:hypothetical protein